MKKVVTIVFLLFLGTSLYAQADGENVFSPIWSSLTWAEGAWYPSGPVFSMEGPFDFDGDGMGEFLISSSWTGSFTNGVYLLEAVDDTTYEFIWWYHFVDLDTAADNYSSIAVGDLDDDSNPEILVLTDCYEGQDGLQIFELDPETKSFPVAPTATWNLELPRVWEAGAISVANLDSDDNQEVIVSVMDGPWYDVGTSHLIIFELQNKNFDFPSWHVEMHDDSTTGWSGYLAEPMDLDKDGKMEVFTVGWLYFQVIIYENTGEEDSYERQCKFMVSLQDEFCNEGVAVADFDKDGVNELYVSSTGDYYGGGPSHFWVMTHDGDLKNLTWQNFHLIKEYSYLGLRGLKIGNLDSTANTPEDGPDVYIAGNYHEAIYDWEYTGGEVTDPASYTEYVIFQDDTTDDVTPPYDQGKVRPTKMVLGDMNNNGEPEIAFCSASLALDKPTLFVIEHGRTTPVRLIMPNELPHSFSLKQNYPNPFNPTTKIEFQIPQAEHVVIKVYNSLGQEVKTLADQKMNPGYHHVTWDGRNEQGMSVGSGMYIYTIKAGDFKASRKMLLMQ